MRGIRTDVQEMRELLKEEIRREIERAVRGKQEEYELEKRKFEIRIREMEEKMQNLERKGEGVGGKLIEEIGYIKSKLERQDRSDRKNNIVIKGLRGGERGGRRIHKKIPRCQSKVGLG